MKRRLTHWLWHWNDIILKYLQNVVINAALNII